jgi:hypothetical protein
VEVDIFKSSKLGQAFDNTSASYKFYWLLGILDLLAEGRSKTLPIKDIQARMVARAFTSVAYFKLSLGKQDKLQDIITSTTQKGLKTNEKSTEVFNAVKQEHKLLNQLDDLVPTRFLSPWITKTKGLKNAKLTREIEKLSIESQKSNSPTPYYIDSVNQLIVMNPDWSAFLLENKVAIEDFTKLRLVRFLESRNPHTLNISMKLQFEIKRSSLADAKKYWDNAIEKAQGELINIYTSQPLNKPFAIDHFIPFSFVAHDLAWNLIPTDQSSNSKKSDKLPELMKFLKPFAKAHHIALQANKLSKSKCLDDYQVAMSVERPQLVELSCDDLTNKLKSLLEPRIMQAKVCGFDFS